MKAIRNHLLFRRLRRFGSILLFAFLVPLTAWSQYTHYTAPWLDLEDSLGFTIIDGLTIFNMPLFGCSGQGYLIDYFYTISTVPNTCNYADSLATVSYSDYFVAQQGVTYGSLNGFSNGHYDPIHDPEQFDVYYISKVGTPHEVTTLIAQDNNPSCSSPSCSIPDMPFTPSGSPGDLLHLHWELYLSPFGGQLRYVDLYFPILVEGVVQDSVEILGTAVTPDIPYMILHDPPGDGSFSTFSTSETVCREFSETVSNIMTSTSNVEATVGIAGSAGFIVTTDFEFSTSISAGLEVSESQSTTGTYETCIETMQTIETSSAEDGIGRTADKFIGYGHRFFLGEYEIVEYNGCSVIIDTAITYARDPSYISTFVKTEQEIMDDIIALQLDVNNTSLPDTARNMAANQIEVWEDVLNINETNYNNNNIVLDPGRDVDNTNYSLCRTVSTTNTQSITMGATVTKSIGNGFTVEFGAVGVNGTQEFSFEKSLETTNTESMSTSDQFCYTLTDDEGGTGGDDINIKVELDPSYGSPIFKTNPGSVTSCPYESGYRRDQPEINADSPQCPDLTGQKTVNIGNIAGGSISITLNICNESNEVRDYKLKRNDNVSGISTEAQGDPITNDDPFTVQDVPAEGCLQFDIEVNKTGQGNVYSGVTFSLYPSCGGLAEETEAVEMTYNLSFDDPTYADSDCDGILDPDDPCPTAALIYDNALDFDGTNDRVSLPAFNLNSNTVTLEAWVYPDGIQDAHDGIIFCRAGNTLAGLKVNDTGDGFHYAWNGGVPTWNSGPALIPNQWQHVALVVEPDKATIYHNGVPYVHTTAISPEEFDGTTLLGRDNVNNNRYFNGRMDEVRIWNTSRSQYDIQYNLGKKLTGTETGLVAYYDFENGTPCENNAGLTTLTDRTSNGHDGTLLSFALLEGFPPFTDGCTSNWVQGITREKNTDGDAYPNACDNCPYRSNSDQTDSDGDGVGDLCDHCEGHDDAVDTDGDGVPDGCDPCPNSVGTTLNMGDILFTGYSADSNSFSFIFMRPVESCTAVRFIDRGWLPYGEFNEHLNDRSMSFVTGRRFGCGEQITIKPSGAFEDTGASAGVVAGEVLTLATAGDQLFAYQGDTPVLWDQSSFVAAISMNNGWQTTSTNQANSALPTVFTENVNAFAITPEFDNANFDCTPATSHPDSIRSALMDQANWIKSNNMTGITIPPLCGLSCCTDSLTLASIYSGVSYLFEAASNITSTGTVESGSQIDYSSGEEIDLNANFQVDLGGDFHAYIEGCTTAAPFNSDPNKSLQGDPKQVMEKVGVETDAQTEKEPLSVWVKRWFSKWF